MFFLYFILHREATSLMDCSHEAESARRPLYFWHMINLLLWLPIYVIMICVFLCCTNSCYFVSWIAYVHREHHWWIASAKLNPPEGHCIFGIWSIYCYDCQWSIYCYDQFIVIVIMISVFICCNSCYFVSWITYEGYVRCETFETSSFDNFCIY